MAARKKSRRRHPGVTLIKPEPDRRIGWRARWRDPDSGKVVKETLDVGLRTAELREEWAARKSKALAKRRLELEAGAHRETGTAFEKALDRYFEDHDHLRAGTLGIYRHAAGKVKAWAKGAGLKSADELRGPNLVALRASLAKQRAPAPARGGKRGERRATGRARAPTTVNRDLRAVRTILGYVRKLGLLPYISSDDLADGLERLPVSHEENVFLKPAELRTLLDSALEHDAAVYVMTREEHAGRRPLGSTAKYQSIAPCVMAAILTGMRYSELVTLDWSQVDLDALDNDGNACGEIHLTSATKTRRARTIDLSVSPALRRLLEAMQKQKAKGRVFGLTHDAAKSAARRMNAEYGAPERWTWQVLRSTCGSYLTNAPGIFGAASAYRSAKQLGHSVQVAERHYVGVIRGIPSTARTLEAAMQIAEDVERVIEVVEKGARAGESV
jgi:integrase